MNVLPTHIRVIVEFYIITNPFVKEKNLAAKLRQHFLLVGIYYGHERTRQSSITKNRALIIPERIIAGCVKTKTASHTDLRQTNSRRCLDAKGHTLLLPRATQTETAEPMA